MKKNIFLIIVFIICIIFQKNYVLSATQSNDENMQSEITNQQEQYGISEFINKSKNYTSDVDVSDIFNKSVSGKFDNNKIIKTILDLLGNSFKSNLVTISTIIIVVIINSILKAISENLGNSSVSKIAYYVQYILIVTLLMKNFSDIILSIKNAVQDLTGFSTILIPLMTTLIIATGNLTTSSLIEPILLSMVSFVSYFLANIVIPLVLVATSLGIISKLSDQIRIDKLSKFLNKTSIWVITTVLGIFVGIASMESGLTNNLDNLTKRAGKSIVSNAVPVVGKILGDAIDTIVGYTGIIKNATGIVGIVVIISICAKPIINLITLIAVYNVGVVFCEPVADKKIVELIEVILNTFKILLAILFTITLMIVIGVALLIKITS